jgi:hypothetical protein
MADVSAYKQRRHPEYSDYEEVFTLYYAAYKGGYEWLKDVATYLHSHRLESATDFTRRQERAFYVNYCKRVVDAYTNYIFKNQIVRSEDPQLQAFFQNADGMGGTIDDVMKKVACLSSVYGRVDCIVDAPVKEAGKELSVRQAKEGNLLPYVILRSPIESIDWSLDAIGNFNWVLFKYTFYQDEDPDIERDTSNAYRYKMITREQWVEFNENDEIIGSGPNELGEVFVHRCYNKLDNGLIGTSLIADIAYINKEIFNWTSLISEQIYKQTFSQLVVPDDGEYYVDNYTSTTDTVGETAANREANPELRSHAFESKVGTSWAFTYPAASGHPPQYISPDRDQIDVVWKLIGELIVEIYQMAGLGSGEGSADASGRAKQRQFVTVDASLKAKAETLERAENEILRLFCARQGMEFTDEYKSSYPKEFDVLSFVEELESELKIATACISPELNKYVLRRVAMKFIEEAPADIKKLILEEIKNGDGSILVQAGSDYVRISPDMESTVELTNPLGANSAQTPNGDEPPSIQKRRQQDGEGPLTSKVRRKAGVDNKGNQSASDAKTIE